MDWRAHSDELAQVIDGLATIDVASMGAHDLSRYVEELNRQLRRLDYVRHDATACLEIGGYLLELGYRTLAQWHRDRLHMTTPAAGRVGSLARSLVHLPTVAKHWAEGNLDAEAARAIAALRTEVTETLFDEAEGYLADAAAGCDHYDLRRVCREWMCIDHIHPHAPGGATTPDNGRGACHPCNRTRPQRRFTTNPPREPPDHDP